MNTELQFNFKDQQVRTITDENGEIWFAGVDVCSILEYAHPKQTIEKLDEDERKLDYVRHSSGQQRKTWTINEPGLFSLILSSSKPEAKAFKRWVTHEVLPKIRKAGLYTTDQEQEHAELLKGVASEIQDLRAQKKHHQEMTNELRKKIEEKTSDMIELVHTDLTQLKLFTANNANE